MRVEARDSEVLEKLAIMPFLDRLELATVCGVSEGLAHNALASLKKQKLIGFDRHASPLTESTRRYFLTPAGVRRLADRKGISHREILHRFPVSAQWERVLFQRLDAVAVIYRLASAFAGATGSLEVGWYRRGPLDCVFILSDGRTVGVVRRGPTADETSFGKRLWRLLKANQQMPAALLILLPDDVRLLRTRRRLATAFLPVFLALEEQVAQADADQPIWRMPSFSNRLDLSYILSRVLTRGSIPAAQPVKRASMPDELEAAGPPKEIPAFLLTTILKASEKRMLDCLFQWPWITSEDLAGILGVSRSGVYQTASRLGKYGLVSRIDIGGRRRLALSDRGLALLARRDRTSLSVALNRWSVDSQNGVTSQSWRNIPGKRSRHLARYIDHTSAVYGFVAALSRQAREVDGFRVLQVSPADQAARYFRHAGVLRSVHPDAFGMVQRGDRTWPFFLEWERRAVRPSTMADRLAPYLRYYSSYNPMDDHGAWPLVLIIFDDHLVEANFLGVARREMKRTGTKPPMWASHKVMIQKEGPLGRAWRNPDFLEYTDPFTMVSP